MKEPVDTELESPLPDVGIATALPQNSNNGTYGFDTGGIASYVVPPTDAEMEVIDALQVVPEHQIVEEEKKSKRLYVIGGIFLLVIVLLVVIAVVAVTLQKRANNESEEKITNPPSQAPTASPTEVYATTLTELYYVLESLYDEPEEFAPIFSNTSSPQYQAAVWTAESAVAHGIDVNDRRMLSRFALATFYFSTDGDNWSYCGRNSTLCDASQEWLTGANECNWYAIGCIENGFDITSIFFPTKGGIWNNMAGTLPNELSFLSKLTVFVLSRGPLSGTIPSWSKLSTLQVLILNNHEFEGAFPTHLLGQNPSLKTVQFQNVSFQGPFLEDILPVESTYLTDLTVSWNKFNGPITSQLSRLPSLRTLDVGHNHFTGTLPKELFSLTSLTTLEVGSTNLSGTLPTSLFSLENLRKLDLSSANFTGPLPGLFASLANLRQVILHNNGFNGTIPSDFERLSQLETLELHDNNLSGSVTEELCNRRDAILILTVDCLGDMPEVSCACCTNCP